MGSFNIHFDSSVFTDMYRCDNRALTNEKTGRITNMENVSHFSIFVNSIALNVTTAYWFADKHTDPVCSAEQYTI